MTKLENYFFVESHPMGFFSVVVNPPKNEDNDNHVKVAGSCYGRNGFPDGSFIATSTIQKMEGDVAITRSGSQYLLGKKHPDFLELEDAIKRGIPVIVFWDLDWYSDGEYSFEGWLENGQEVYGKVTSQNKNLITIDGNQYFVIWRNLKNIFTYQMFIKRYFRCEEAWNEEIRPVLM